MSGVEAVSNTRIRYGENGYERTREPLPFVLSLSKGTNGNDLVLQPAFEN